MRKKVIVGNWKMHFTPATAQEFVSQIKDKINIDSVDVVLCVPFVSLQYVMDELKDTNIQVGAQNMHYMVEGDYTGEISGKMLEDIGVKYVIIGHSERRERFAETDTTVNLKVLQAIEHNITPIICIGESDRQRISGRTNEVLRKQIAFALDELTAQQVAGIIIAYEPIWAIGAGKTPATFDQAEDACAHIRKCIYDRYGVVAAQSVRILYGGSVKPENAREFFTKDNIDGGLAGKASQSLSFVEVVNFV